MSLFEDYGIDAKNIEEINTRWYRSIDETAKNLNWDIEDLELNCFYSLKILLLVLEKTSTPDSKKRFAELNNLLSKL